MFSSRHYRMPSLPMIRPFLRPGFVVLPLLALLLTPLPAGGAESVEGPTTYALKLEPNADIATGMIGIVGATAEGERGDHYVVENLNILQPVEVVVVTRSPTDEVKVQLCKHLWDQPEQEGSTAGKGFVSFKFRTEGDLKIRVASPGGECAYQLAVWAGEPLKRTPPSPFVSMAAFRKNQSGAAGGASSPVLWVIAGLLGLVVVLLAVLVLKKKRS
jgi:hypothetical protein